MRYVTVYGLEGLACTAVSEKRYRDAARLYGAAEVLRNDIGVPRTSREGQLYRKYIEDARQRIGPEEWKSVLTEAGSGPLSPILAELVQDALKSSTARG
ncbi:MAG: hypothetical protein ACR2MC_00885 [Actinomycetota bacterium]